MDFGTCSPYSSSSFEKITNKLQHQEHRTTPGDKESSQLRYADCILIDEDVVCRAGAKYVPTYHKLGKPKGEAENLAPLAAALRMLEL